MKRFLTAVFLMAIGNSSIAMIPDKAKPSASEAQEEKICLVVRKSIYGKYRKKCKNTQEWLSFIAKYGPKIEKQLANTGATRGLNGNAKFTKVYLGANKEK